MGHAHQIADETSDAASGETATLYRLIGGEPGLRHLVDRFYAIMDQDPAAADIRAMHGDDLAPVQEKLFAFLSGWLGGPRLYGGCVMGAHRAFSIGPEERDQWLMCMTRALAESAIDPQVRALLERPFFAIADFMRNRESRSDDPKNS